MELLFVDVLYHVNVMSSHFDTLVNHPLIVARIFSTSVDFNHFKTPFDYPNGKQADQRREKKEK